MKIPLYWKIIIGLILGILFGILAASQGWGQFTSEWIAPFGKIFISLLKLIAVPLVLSSLITGVASLSNLQKLSRIGGKTIMIYILTTAVAATIGLVAVNVLQPGDKLPNEMKLKLQESYQNTASGKMEAAEQMKDRSALQPFIDMVPQNFFSAASNNRNMLQVVFVSIIIGIALIQIKKSKADPMLNFFESLNEVVIKLVENIMLMAPIGVFSLISDTITTIAGNDISKVFELLGALGFYMIAVIIGLILQMLITYTAVLKIFSNMSLKKFYKGLAPAQLLAFSTSSSGATLPVTMDRCEKELGVPEEVSSFVLPLGATINMDGTALYQAIAAVFIAQTLGMDLTLGAQATIVLTAVLASIGTAAVPGAGIITLVIILEAIGVPSVGLALILGVDRILDMLRTVTNVTGDASVAVAIASSERKI